MSGYGPRRLGKFCRDDIGHGPMSPKPERYDDIRFIQAEHIVMHLTRCGRRIVKVTRDTGPKPSK